ncbi:hypothetical protein HRI_000805600 [Hibiscus trionum]|uniref:GST N-terminal domain-containing protein n=1 Tax=Hibiscus trionum TaxID=183268 RepID=A0A9W7H6K4_HIBTR|nr:hypothetical protein HRI_000805600 [Hibiscus trionum]
MGTEYLLPPLDATAEEPALFDGTTRLYMTYTCPFAQRVWITRNFKVLSFPFAQRVWITRNFKVLSFPFALHHSFIYSCRMQITSPFPQVFHVSNLVELQGLHDKIKLVPLNLC